MRGAEKRKGALRSLIETRGGAGAHGRRTLRARASGRGTRFARSSRRSGLFGFVDLAAEQLAPAVDDLLVQAIRDEDEHTLQRGSDGKQNSENIPNDDCLTLREQGRQETK